MCVLRSVTEVSAGRLLVSGTYVADEVYGNESLCGTQWRVHFDPVGESAANKYITRFRGEYGGFGKHPTASHTEFRVSYSPTDKSLTFEPYLADLRASEPEKRSVYAKRNVWRQISVSTAPDGVAGVYQDFHHGNDTGASSLCEFVDRVTR